MAETFNLFGDQSLAQGVNGLSSMLFGDSAANARNAAAAGTLARARAQVDQTNMQMDAQQKLSALLRSPETVNTPEGRAALYSAGAWGGPQMMQATPGFVRGYAGAMPWASQNENEFSFLAAGAGSPFTTTPTGQQRALSGAMQRRLAGGGGGGSSSGGTTPDGQTFEVPTRVQPQSVTISRAAQQQMEDALTTAWETRGGSLAAEGRRAVLDRAGQIYQRTRNAAGAVDQAIQELEEAGYFTARNRRFLGFDIPGTETQDLNPDASPRVSATRGGDAPQVPAPLRGRPNLQWSSQRRLWRDPGTGQVFNQDGTVYVPPTRGRR